MANFVNSGSETWGLVRRSSVKFLSLFLFTAVFIAAVPGARAAPEDWKSCENTQGEAAIQACTRLVSSGAYQGRDLAEIYYNRGTEYLLLEDKDHAIADFSVAISLYPLYEAAYNNRGGAWQLKGDDDRAIADFNEALRINPKEPCSYYNRARSRGNKGEYALAIADYDEAVRLNPQYRDAFFNRAVTWAEFGNLGRALADFDEVLRLDQRHAGALYMRGVVKKGLGDKAGGEKDMAAAKKIDPKADAPMPVFAR
jgi:tetratricopeptide (TPR) repeat protein